MAAANDTAKPSRDLARKFAASRAWARGKSLLAYIFQSVFCFVILGPLLSVHLFRLAQSWGMPPQNAAGLPLFGAIFLGPIIGFAASLAIDWRRAPLRSCLPLPRLRLRGGLVPNRSFCVCSGTGLKKSGIFAGRSFLFGLWLSLGLGALVIIASNTLVLLLGYFFPALPTLQMEQIERIFAGYSGLQVFFLVVLSPAILEELVYRGRGFGLLARYWGNPAAFVLTSLVFALSHASPVESISLLPLAFYLGWLRWRSGNLAFAMLVHLQNNGLAFLWHSLS